MALAGHLAERVKSGDAHWVTVKQGPLEGRHLLIEGARPEKGAVGKGKILAGKGIPVHVIEKLAGTHAHHIEDYEHTEHDPKTGEPDDWKQKELQARKEQRQHELGKLKTKLAAVEAKIDKHNAKRGDSHLDQVHQSFHLGRVGGSGNRRNISRLNARREAELDRTIDNAKAYVELMHERDTLKNKIQFIESGRADAVDKMTKLKKPEHVKAAEAQQKAADTSALTDKEHKAAQTAIKETQKMIDQRKHLIQEFTQHAEEFDGTHWQKDVTGATKAIEKLQSVLANPQNKLQFEEAKKELSKWKKTMKDSFYGQQSYESQLDMINFLKEHNARRAKKHAPQFVAADGRLLVKRA